MVDIDEFKKVLDENDKELVNWKMVEHNGCCLLKVDIFFHLVISFLSRSSISSILSHSSISSYLIPKAAAEFGQQSFMSTLLDRGASIDIRNNTGHTALMMSAQFGHPSCISMLLDRGAVIDLVDEGG